MSERKKRNELKLEIEMNSCSFNRNLRFFVILEFLGILGETEMDDGKTGPHWAFSWVYTSPVLMKVLGLNKKSKACLI